MYKLPFRWGSEKLVEQIFGTVWIAIGITVVEMNLNNVKKVRISKGLSRYKVSKDSGIWYKSLCEIEDNKTDVKLSTLRKIAAAMNCEVSDLV